MSHEFDPYHLWLGIPRDEQPPHLYRLLGAPLFETKPEVIESAADRQMLHLKTFQTGKHAAHSQRLMNEVTAAKVCLLNPAKKAAYDAQLRVQIAAPARPAVPVASVAAPAVEPAAAPAFNFSVAAPSRPVKRARQSSPPLGPMAALAALVVVLLIGGAVYYANQRAPEAPPAAPRQLAQEKLPSAPIRPATAAPASTPASAPAPLAALPQFQAAAAENPPRPLEGAPPAAPEIKPAPPVSPAPSPAASDVASVAPQPAAVTPVQTTTSPPSTEGPSAADAWVNLLEWAEGVDWKARGIEWNDNLALPPTKDGISLKPIPFNRFPLPAIIDGDYEMEVEFTRNVGGESVNVFFPLGDHNMHLELGAEGGRVGGVHWIDGEGALRGNPTTRRPWPIVNHRKYRVVIRTRRDGEMAAFEVDWDGSKNYIQWEGPYSSLTNVEGGGWRLTMVRHPWIGSWDSRVRFHKVQVRMLSGTIRRDVISEADRAADLKEGLVRLVGETAGAPSVGFGRFVVNQIPRAHGAGGCERDWPWMQPEFSVCEDFYGAHAPSRLKCPIPKAAKSFTAVGYNDISRTTKFLAFVDGKQVYDSGITGLAAIELDLPADATLLELVIDAAGRFDYDASYWCYPKFHNVALDKVTDRMRQARSSPLRFVIASSTVGFKKLTHNEAIESYRSVPLALPDAQACHEFLYAHAPSSVTYAVPDGMTRFTAIGYCPKSRHVKFQVWADARQVYESPQVGIIPIDVRLPRGTKTIELKVADLGNRDFDVSMWCYPRLHAK